MPKDDETLGHNSVAFYRKFSDNYRSRNPNVLFTFLFKKMESKASVLYKM